MVAVHCVGELARFGTSQCVSQVAIRVESRSIQGRLEKPVLSNQHRMIGDGEGEMREGLRVWVFLFVVMDFVTIKDDGRVLRYVHPVVHKVLGREVRRSQPERRVGPLHLQQTED